MPCGVARPESSLLARKIGIDVPVYPVKGYTATIPLDDDKGPTMGGVDEDRLIAYSRPRQPAAHRLHGRIRRL